MHKAVIFDLGKTLVDFDFSRGYRALQALCPYPAAEMPRRLAATGLVERFETGLIEPRDFVAEMARALDLAIGYEQFCGIWNHIFTEALVPEVMLRGLAARYRLVLLSNTNAIHIQSVLCNYPMLRHFHHLVLSHEERAMKPDPEIYRAAVAAAGCEPGECFYTDDIPAYAEAARNLGIDAVPFKGLEQLKRDLAERGIEWE